MFGLAALAVVVMIDANSQLVRLEADGQAFDSSIFTGFHPRFWDTAEFVLAEEQWDSAIGFKTDKLVALHVAADIVFVFIYPMLIALGLRKLGVPDTLSFPLGFFMGIGDLVETVAAGLFLVGPFEGAAHFGGVLVQFSGAVKWVAIAVTVVVAVTNYFGTDDGLSARNTVSQAALSREGRAQEPWTALAGIVIVVAVFALFVALPAGGPLEQLPDVLRSQLDPERGNRQGWFVPSVAVVFAVAAVGAAGFVATGTAPRSGARRVPRSRMVAVSFGISGALYIGGGWLENGWQRAVPWAAFIVVATTTGLACVVDQARTATSKGSPARPADPASALSNDVGAKPWWRRLYAAVAGLIRTCLTDPDTPVPPSQGPDQARSALWVASLAGVVATAAALGLVRAALLPALYAPSLGWIMWAVGAGALTVTAGWVTRVIVERLVRIVGDRLLKLAVFVGVVALAAAALLAVFPALASRIGANGVLAVAVGAFSFVVATLMWLGSRVWRWDVPTRLGWGIRTPWLTVLVTIWAMASFLNTAGGYHDARVARVTTSHTVAQAAGSTLEQQFDLWLQEPRCVNASGSRPLYLVAAPGGGIRAAYWTASGLEALFGSDGQLPCSQLGPFAVSGVSGGSVGTAIWLATAGTDIDTVSAVKSMSEDRALAQAIAGMLFRDLPQPLVGFTDLWADRAELIERVWLENDRFGGATAEVALAELGNLRDGWRPVAIFNGTSVSDGCRALLSNTPGLTANRSNCQEAPASGESSNVPFASAVAFSTNLFDPATGDCTTEDAREAGGTVTVPAVTAALASARFPYVTPSGAFYRCLGQGVDAVPTYVVDGGYAENSGLLTLLGVWEDIEPLVREHNALNPGQQIEPWIILLDNHYRSSVSPSKPTRPKEVFVPLLAYGAAGRLTPEALEQVASFEMSLGVGCTGQGHVGCPSTYLRIAPILSPGPSAPLGWVLSEASMGDLDDSLIVALSAIPSK